MKCPGQDFRNLRVSLHKCPNCGHEVEIFSDEARIKCPQCGNSRKFYAKLVDNQKIDKDFQRQGKLPYPKDNTFKCNCGFEIDLTGMRNDIETKVGKKIVL